MPTARDRRIDLAFADAITVLLEACRFPASGRGALAARVRHLQRLGLPARPPEERMSRITYGIAELAALATALRLMAAFMMPAIAVRYVTERWDVLAPWVLAGALEALPAEYRLRRPIGTATLVVFAGNALDELGGRGRRDERLPGELGAVALADPAADTLATLIGGGAVAIDARHYMPALVRHAAALALATDADLAVELDILRHAC